MYNELLIKYGNIKQEEKETNPSIKTKNFPEIKNEEKKQKKEENKIIGKKTNNQLEEKNKISSFKNQKKEEINESKSEKELNSDEEIDEYYKKISGIPSKIKKDFQNNQTIQKPTNSNIKESRFFIEEENLYHNNIPDDKNIDIDEFGENENIFNETIPLNITYDWSDQYTPIKPRYSNRVRVGYEWNKYN